MRGLPSIGVQNTSRINTDVFGGFRDTLKIGDGEWNFTKNLTSNHYPMLASRGPRGVVNTLTEPGGMLEKDALALVDNGTLYYNGQATGLTGLSSGEKQMVSMGAYLCIWPDKKYINTEKLTDYGSMEASYSTQGTIAFSACRSDGSVYERVASSDSEPNHDEYDVWIDTSGTPAAMEWSTSAGGWVEIPTMYTKLTFTSQGAVPSAFSEMDGVEISGSAVDFVNGDKVIYALGGEENVTADWIVVVGLLENAFTQESGAITIQRKVPKLDYVCECQNRLWGCFYGNEGDKNLNEIYCCALGDFRNWRQYLGVSTDSWTASVGSDGVWTGAANYLGHPVFFKENVIHMVTVSSYGAHRIDETICRGVQKGSWRSIQVVNETLYYKSRVDVCAWQGGFPESVSEALGEKKYYDARAGAFGGKYYISMKDAYNVWSLFVYDIARGIWLREDDLQALCFAKVDDELFCISSDKKLIALNGSVGTLESTVSWEAESGILHYEYADRKYLSRFNIRLALEEGAEFDVWLQYDSDGVWRNCGKVRHTRIGTVTLPIRPRRCDHLKMKLNGQGGVRVFSITRILEVGSDK